MDLKAALPIPPIEHRYGSDLEGLIWGYRFVLGQPAQPIDLLAAVEFLNQHSTNAEGEFLWLHFSLSNSSTVTWLRQNFALPEAFFESLNSSVGSTRLEQDQDSLVAVLNDVVFDFKLDPSSVSTATLCISPRLLVSTRLRPLRALDQLRSRVRSGKLFRSSVELSAHLLEDQSNGLVNILRQSTTIVDQIEDRLLENRIHGSRRELGSLRRVLVRLQRLLAPEPAAFFRLLSKPPDWIAEDDLNDLRQAAEGFSVAIADSLALVDRIKILQEELAALVGEQTNRTLFVLTLVTVLALPVNMITGMFGMNIGGIPFSDWEYGFFWMFTILIFLTSTLAILAMRRFRKQE